MKRDTILIIISVVFLGISAYIVYTSFFSVPESLNIDLTAIGAPTETNTLNVRGLGKQIETSLKNLGPDGSWNRLESSSQYQALTPEANIGVQIGVYGQRTNPFLQIKYSTSTDAE